MDNDKKVMSLIQLNNYVKPIIREEKSRGFVLNGHNNTYFKYVNDRYIGSPTNSAIINGYISWIYGKGLSATDQSQKPQQFARLYSMLKKSDIRRIVTDYESQNMAYLQIVRNRDNTISSITHIAVDKIAPEIADEDNVINAYYYSQDFAKRKYIPQRIPAFGVSNKPAPVEIYCIRPYQLGMDYFALPTYQSCLQWAELEEEISNYSINHIKNGLSNGWIISVPDSYNYTDEQKAEIENKIKQKLTGSPNAGAFIINFSNGENAIEVTTMDVNDAHNKWEWLSSESARKIITSHEVVSPMLFGIKDSNGFSSNADELGEAERQTIDRVVKPKQNAITDALEEVLSTDGITLNLYFRPLSERKEVVELSKKKDVAEIDGATPGMADVLIEFGEEKSDEYELLCSSIVDYEMDDEFHNIINLSDLKQNTGRAIPNAKSEQDSEDIKIRYRYVNRKGQSGDKAIHDNSRDFCVKMCVADKLYRKEDIIRMEKDPLANEGFQLGGMSNPGEGYSIWKWKGGGKISEKYPNGTCKHKWQREIYLKVNGNVDVNSPIAQELLKISTTEARRRGYKVPTNDKNVGLTPHQNRIDNGAN